MQTARGSLPESILRCSPWVQYKPIPKKLYLHTGYINALSHRRQARSASSQFRIRVPPLHLYAHASINQAVVPSFVLSTRTHSLRITRGFSGHNYFTTGPLKHLSALPTTVTTGSAALACVLTRGEFDAANHEWCGVGVIQVCTWAVSTETSHCDGDWL